MFKSMTAIVIAGMVTAGPLMAQSQNCGPHEAVVQRLAERYGESRQIIAMTADQSVMEVFASAETGSWTVTITRAGQPTCLVAAGQNYQTVEEALPSDDESL